MCARKKKADSSGDQCHSGEVRPEYGVSREPSWNEGSHKLGEHKMLNSGLDNDQIQRNTPHDDKLTFQIHERYEGRVTVVLHFGKGGSDGQTPTNKPQRLARTRPIS